MKSELQISKVEDSMLWLESSAHDYTATQSIAWLIDHVGQLCTTLAFVNNQMAVAKKLLNDKKVAAYHSLISSEVANEKYFAPSLAKDYVSAQCSEDQYAYDLCERASRTVTHILEILRSVLSALKEESKQMYNNKNSTP